MGDKVVFNIGKQEAKNIYMVAGDLTINESSPPEDIAKVVQAMQAMIAELDLEGKGKKLAQHHLNGAVIELEDAEPDKKSITESVKSAVSVIKEAKDTGEAFKDVGAMLGKVAFWLGTNVQNLGWPF